MTNNANQKRQPKGTSDGGKFAPDANAECTLELAPESFDPTEVVKTPDEAIAWCEGELENTVKEYDEMVEAGKSDDPDALDMRDYMDELRDQLVGHQRDLIADLRNELKASRGSFDLEESITGNICARLGVDGKFEQVLGVVSGWDPNYENFDNAISSETDRVMDELRDDLVAILGEIDW